MKTFIKMIIGFVGGILTSLGICVALAYYLEAHAGEDNKVVNFFNELDIDSLEKNGYVVEEKPDTNVVKMGFH